MHEAVQGSPKPAAAEDRPKAGMKGYTPRGHMVDQPYQKHRIIGKLWIMNVYFSTVNLPRAEQ